MSNPFSGSTGSAPGTPRLPTPPTGWPIGSYGTYEEAQRAVDHLTKNDFPVQEVTIVGVDLMEVERVIRRLSWGTVLGNGAANGAWFGLFVGLIMGMFASEDSWVAPVLVGLGTGVFFGLVAAAVGYATRGQRDFYSARQLVAGRYDVLAQPGHAELGRDLLGKLAMRPRSS